MVYISLQLEGSGGVFRRKNLKTREPSYASQSWRFNTLLAISVIQFNKKIGHGYFTHVQVTKDYIQQFFFLII